MTYWPILEHRPHFKSLSKSTPLKYLATSLSQAIFRPLMNDHHTQPLHHSWVQTQDGSWTLFSERFQEACHSTTGAETETDLHYIKGCSILDLESPSILEVGFGLGVGFLTTYRTLLDSNKSWSFLSLEIDRDLVEWFRLENVNHPFLSKLKWEGNLLKAQNDQVTLIILVGDARKVLPAFLEDSSFSWNAIYQDAFSPKKNPSLWTKEWFELLKKFSTHDVKLSTYSASSSIRKSLLEAGWTLSKGEKFGPKRTSTRASLTGFTDPEILLHLERSPVSALTDDNIQEFLHN